jgi:hypothetical protein
MTMFVSQAQQKIVKRLLKDGSEAISKSIL